MATRSKKGRVGRLEYDWAKADAWMEKNPTAAYPVFKEAFPDYPFTDATYYGRRRKLVGPTRSISSPKKTLYETMGQFEMKEVKKMDAVTAMRRLLGLIDKHSRTHVEIVQLVDPDALEIRRFTR